MQTVNYPLEKVRDQFPALQRTFNKQKVAYFDGPGGSQVAQTVIDSMSTYMRNGVANLGAASSTSNETNAIVEKAREDAASLLGADKDEIAFGANMTTLAFRVAQAISKGWIQSEGNIVVTEIDHHANVDPWMTAAQDKGLGVNTIKFNPNTFTLDLENLNDVITEKTKLVAVGLSSNAIGTINDVSSIIKRAREVGALVAIDAVHAVPHFSVNFKELDTDFLFCSAYKFFGPHVGIVAIRKEVFENLELFKLQPAPDHVPEKLETGTLNFEGLVGVSEAIHFIASLGEGELLKERLNTGYEKMEKYENGLAQHLREGLAEIEGVTLYQAPKLTPKTPTVAFRVKGFEPKKVCRKLAEEHALHLECGDFYAMTLVEKLDVGAGGVIRAGIGPYNTEEEMDRLISAIKLL